MRVLKKDYKSPLLGTAFMGGGF